MVGNGYLLEVVAVGGESFVLVLRLIVWSCLGCNLTDIALSSFVGVSEVVSFEISCRQGLL